MQTDCCLFLGGEIDGSSSFAWKSNEINLHQNIHLHLLLQGMLIQLVDRQTYIGTLVCKVADSFFWTNGQLDRNYPAWLLY